MTEAIFSVSYPERRATIPTGLPLVVVLAGLSDAGGAVSQLDTYLWEKCRPEEFVRFDSDELLDYRARRPVITFDEDHLTGYEPEKLVLAVAHDEMGAPFLLLSGFEPDFRWNAFIDTVLLLQHELQVSSTVWVHSLPVPVPHTRPLGCTVSGSRDDLIESHSVWRPTTRIAASAGHVLGYRLHNLGEEVVGFALLVPHYLSNTEVPDALLTALNGIMSATGLLFTTDETRERAREFLTQVDTQIAESEESQEMVRGLEDRYDRYMEEQSPRSTLVAEDGSLPTAEQLASELEQFLAEQRKRSDGE